jgi:hypothetical protein
MTDEICNAPLKTEEGRCERRASKPDGKCGYHTDLETDMDRDWKPNYEHGLYMDRSGYYESMPEADQRWIDAVADELVSKSYYDKSDISVLEKCRQVAIDLHQRRRADEYIGPNMTEEKTVGYHEDYGEITTTEENTLFITKDRLSRESRMTMKDLGIFDQEKEETQEAKSLLSEIAEKVDDD